MAEEECDDVYVTVLEEKGDGVKLQQRDHPEREAWFPASRISYKRRNTITGVALAEIPVWLLDQRKWTK